MNTEGLLGGLSMALWTDEEVNNLREHHRSGLSMAQISRIMRRSVKSIANKIHKACHAKDKSTIYKENAGSRNWTRGEDEELKRLYNIGVSLDDIALKLGRSRSAAATRKIKLLGKSGTRKTTPVRNEKVVECMPDDVYTMAKIKLATRLKFNNGTQSYFLDGAPVRVHDIVREAGMQLRGME